MRQGHATDLPASSHRHGSSQFRTWRSSCGGTIDATCVTRWHQGAATTGGEWEWYSTCCTLATGYSYCWTAQNPTGSAVKPDPVQDGEPSTGGTTSGGSTVDPN